MLISDKVQITIALNQKLSQLHQALRETDVLINTNKTLGKSTVALEQVHKELSLIRTQHLDKLRQHLKIVEQTASY